MAAFCRPRADTRSNAAAERIFTAKQEVAPECEAFKITEKTLDVTKEITQEEKSK